MPKNQLKLKFSLSILFLVVVCFISTVRCDIAVVAHFDSGGVKGDITFKKSDPSSSTNITVSLQGLASAVDWKITSSFLNGNGDNNCSPSNIGSVYNPFQVSIDSHCNLQNQQTTCVVGNLTGRYGFIPISGQATFHGDALINLNGNQSIAGRTLAIQVNNKWLCAHLIPSGEIITMSSRMEGQIQGRILFRQLQPTSSLSTTTIYLNLAALHSYEKVTIYNWQIRNTCNLSVAYSPNGDLTAKHSTLNINPMLTNNKILINDADLPLTGSRSIEGKYIALFTTDNRVVKSCGKITPVVAKSVKAILNAQGVSGSIRLLQNSEFDPVRIHLLLNNLNGRATTYGIYQYPVGLKLSYADNPCLRLGKLYNPTYANGHQQNSIHLLPIGDLSGKHGNLTNKLGINKSYTDYRLQLFGQMSIVGRSIAIQMSSQNPTWICSTLNYPQHSMTTARVRLLFPIVGEIIFTQQRTDPYSDTSIYISVSQSGRHSPSVNHNWHVHTIGQLTDTMSTSGRCASASGHYNPSIVNISASDYKMRCKANHLLCELGDLSTRQGGIDISDQIDHFFFTDINTPLSGKHSILDRSMVIHAEQFGASRIACGKVLQLLPSNTTADLKSYGQITISQFDPTSITMVHLNLKNLNSAINGIYIGSTPECVANNIFNPFNQVAPANTQGTNDQYPVGNLTGKLNARLDSMSEVNRLYHDSNLPLYGMESVIGRSVTMISKVNNAIMRCTVLQRQQVASSFTVKGVATFTGPVAIGTITLSLSHNWHVHEQPVYNDAAAAQGRCQSTKGHYNPFLVNVTKPAYNQQCGHSNPLRCEVGDSSAKTEQINLTDNFQLLTKDTYLPLTGQYTVLGRSIVMHAENEGASRIGCADIVPQAGSHAALITLPDTDSRKYNVTTLRSTVKTVVGGEFDIVYPIRNSGQKNCQNIKFYLIGYNAASKTSTINSLIQSNSSVLGDYKPMKACSITGSGQVPLPSLLLMCFMTMLIGIFGH